MNLKKIILRRIIDRFSYFGRDKIQVDGKRDREKFLDTNKLIEEHFKKYSNTNHPCRETLQLALQMLGASKAVIVETGSSAWGTNSSLLFDSYVNSFGGEFYSVDIRIEPLITLRSLCTSKSHFYCDDSINFLTKFRQKKNTSVNLVYLDSWDVNWNDPLPSAIHGFNEFLTILPVLKRNKGSILLVDDTPINNQIINLVNPKGVKGYNSFYETFGFTPGKGALIKEFLLSKKIGSLIEHKYQLLWKF